MINKRIAELMNRCLSNPFAFDEIHSKADLHELLELAQIECKNKERHVHLFAAANSNAARTDEPQLREQNKSKKIDSKVEHVHPASLLEMEELRDKIKLKLDPISPELRAFGYEKNGECNGHEVS